jgi:folate-dependent phosphoribosylglycinamide formyltransferase PurN
VKVIAVFGDGANQCALAHRIHRKIPLAHVARIQLKPARNRRFIRSAVSLTLARSLRTAWQAMDRHFSDRFPDWPAVPSSVYDSANASGLADLVERERPDLVLVSGTDLLSKRTLDRFGTKVMNLHTGISPYIRGGPNCTNWALAINEPDLIGSSVMWIDAGIDSGSIITSERAPLTGRETLPELHIKVMDHAHALYRRAVERFARGAALPSVPQSSIAPGRLFLTKHWNSVAMIRAAFNHRFRFGPIKVRTDIHLVTFE